MEQRGARLVARAFSVALIGRVTIAFLAAIAIAERRAEAYRPFDGTDADVADKSEFELELGPAHYYREGPQNYLVTPSLVLNFGIAEHTELVVDTQQFVAIGSLGPNVPRWSVQGDDVLIKHVFREGTLQDKSGVSIASEGGLLTPEVHHGTTGLGASIDVIASYRWNWGSVHWNEWFLLTRDRHADLFTGAIIEGPHAWRLRPVAEMFVDLDFVKGSKESALVGAIWTLSPSLVLDAGLRGARVTDAWATEARVGLTYAVGGAARVESARR